MPCLYLSNTKRRINIRINISIKPVDARIPERLSIEPGDKILFKIPEIKENR